MPVPDRRTTPGRWQPGSPTWSSSCWPTQPNPPAKDPPHNRAAYARWLRAQRTGGPTPATHTQFDTAAVLPFYAYLAATGAFLENHCSGFGTNSTPNHLLIIGGQSPTLRNPPHTIPPPVWDMPSLPGHAADHGLTWKAYTGRSHYPVAFYPQLAGSANVLPSGRIVADAADLPALSMVWHDSPADEHPTADVTRGQDTVWQAVDAVVRDGTTLPPPDDQRVAAVPGACHSRGLTAGPEADVPQFVPGQGMGEQVPGRTPRGAGQRPPGGQRGRRGSTQAGLQRQDHRRPRQEQVLPGSAAADQLSEAGAT